MRARLLLLVAVVAAAAGLVAPLDALEHLSIDARFRIRGDHTRPHDVMVLGMDGSTFARYGPQLPRRIPARVIRALDRAGARTIAYDIEFIGPTNDRDDIALFNALRATPGVVLAAGNRPGDVLLDPRNQRTARVRVGLALFPGDKGDVLRRLPTTVEGRRTFAALAAGTRLTGRYWIDYRGSPRVVPFLRAVDDELPDLRGKIVVVGDTTIGGQDVHATPLGTRSGPEINAIAVDTLLRGAPLRTYDGWWLIVLLGLGVPLTALRFRGLRWLPFAAMYQVAWPLGAQLAFDGGRSVPFVGGEVALLAGSLGTLVVTYTQEIRHRAQLRAQFARFAPASVVEALVEQDGVPPARLEATVLFADLRGFTSAAERLGAEGVIALLNRYLSAMSDAVLDHGGTVVSFMGDGIMAVFGAPLPQPDHADRAVAAARELVTTRLPGFNRDTGEDFALGVGIATGPVMSGTVGSSRRLEYAAVGDTTNLAARLEQLTKQTPHSVLIADSTRAAMRDPHLVDAGEHAIRGRSQAVRVWTLTGTVAPDDA